MSVLPSDVRYYGSLCDPSYDGSTTLNGAVATNATSLTLASATGFPPSGNEYAVQVDSEIMWVTQGQGTTGQTVIRAFAGTALAAHNSGASVTMPAGAGIDFTAKHDFTDVVSGDTVDIISSLATDTFAIIQKTGRDTTGVIQVESSTLSGATTFAGGAQVWGRLEQATFGASTTITVAAAAASTVINVAGHTLLPATGSCNLLMGREVMTVTSGLGGNALTVARGQFGSAATIHQSGDNVYLMATGDVAVVDHTKVLTNHTSQSGAQASGTTPAFIHLAAADGSQVALGQLVRLNGGTGVGQIRVIIATTVVSNGSTVTDAVGVDSAWGTVPDGSSTYDVFNGMKIDALPNPIATCRRFLWNAAADVPGGSQRIFYQKVYAVNNNTTVALTAAQVQDAANTGTLPTGALLDLATATAANDTVTWVNRQTVPGSGYGSFVTQPSATNYGANSGNLASGATPNSAGAQGIVLRLTLPAGTSSYKGYADLRTTGSTI